MPRLPHAFALIASLALCWNTAAADSPLSVHAAYVRQVPPGITTTGAFMTIRNTGGVERQLTRAESPVAKTVELHTHINENGVMKMREVPRIPVPANSQAELKPGSYHVMLIDLREALKDGEDVPITLTFDDGSTVKVLAPVRKPHAGAPEGKPMQH